MRLPILAARTSSGSSYSSSTLLSSSSSVQTLYSSISPSSSGFIPDSFDSSAPYTQVFVANEDGASVASSSFAEPCRPSEGDGSFYSGVMRKGDMFAVQRTSVDEPVFFYSPNAYDCSNGMVGVLNPSTSQTLSAYADAAKSYAQPGASPSSSSSYGGVLTPLVPLSQQASAADTDVLPDPSGSSVVFATTLPVGTVVGIAVACVIALGMALGGGWFAWSEYTRRQQRNRNVALGDDDVEEGDASRQKQQQQRASMAPVKPTVDDGFEREFSDVRGPGFEDVDDEYEDEAVSGDLADEKLGSTTRWDRLSSDKVAIGTMSVQRSGSF